MLALLSTRLRTWLLLAIALPAVRTLIHRLARRATATDPHSHTSRIFTRADTTLTRWLSRRRGQTAASPRGSA